MPDAAASRLTDIFIQVLHAEPSRRPALIRELCGSDAHLTRDITELVAAAERAPSTGGMVRGMLSSDEPPPLPPGTEIRNYTIERLIATGGMGIVYLARDTALNMQVAIKALKPSIAGDTDHRRRLKHEAQLMAQLAGHPNIATVHALIDEGDALYIVEECLPGPTLREQLAQGPLSAADAIGVGLAVLRALGAAHRQKIVHRDLKPENVMRTSTGSWKVLDFGIARLEAPDPRTTLHATRADQRVGTPLYMSPEQLRGDALDGRSDLFAFGVLLYESLTLRHPFTRRSDLGALSTWTAVLNEPPLPFEADELDRLPPGLPALIMRCLEKEPQQRWSSAEDVEAALQAIESGVTPALAPAACKRGSLLVAIPRGRGGDRVLAGADPGVARAAMDRPDGMGGGRRNAGSRGPHALPRADQHGCGALRAPFQLRVPLAEQAFADPGAPRARHPVGEGGGRGVRGRARRGRPRDICGAPGMGRAAGVARSRQLRDRDVHRAADGA